MAILEKVKSLLTYTSQLKQENADLKLKLAEALSDDIADEQAIADAQLEAQAAKDALKPLQVAIAEDATEDQELIALIDSTLPVTEELEPVEPPSESIVSE